MKFPALPLAAVVASALLCANTSHSRETVLVIGDSLSREYQFEFPTFPEARNWVEILAVHRSDDFYFGPLGTTDLGLLADACDLFNLDNQICNAIGDDGELDRYRYNWAIPTSSADTYAGDLTGSGLFQRSFQDLIDDDFDDVDAVVIFLGGNDIDSVYGSVYNGNTSTANDIIQRIENDLEGIIDFVQDDTPNMRIILVNVPHVGATPEVKADHPTDPIKTGRVTTALETLNDNLRDLAEEKDIGYADISTFVTSLISDDPMCIGGAPFLNEGSDTGAPEYTWLGGEVSQNFHPNTNGQALVANEIIAAFNEKYGIGAQPLSETEIVEDIVGLESPLTEWAQSFGLSSDQRQPEDDPDRDGLNNLIEFALDLDPSTFSTLPTPTVTENDTLQFEYNTRAEACYEIIPERSTDLIKWTPVAPENIENLPGDAVRVTLPGSAATSFIRLKIQ